MRHGNSLDNDLPMKLHVVSIKIFVREHSQLIVIVQSLSFYAYSGSRLK
jgi:hypothetical protein